MGIKVSVLVTGTGPAYDIGIYLYGDGVSDGVVVDLSKYGYSFKTVPMIIQNGTIISSTASGANTNDATFEAVAEMLDEKRLSIKFNKPLEKFVFSPFVPGGPGEAQFDLLLAFEGD